MKASRLPIVVLVLLVTGGAIVLNLSATPEPPPPVQFGKIVSTTNRDRYAIIAEMPRPTAERPSGVVFACDKSRGYAARFDIRDRDVLLRLLKQTDGKSEHSELLGQAVIPAEKFPETVSIKRRRDDIAIEIDGRLVALGHDDAFAAGGIGSIRNSPGFKLRKIPISEFAFDENFDQIDRISSTWNTARGEWDVDTSIDPYLEHVGDGPNYVHYYAPTSEESITVAGRKLWDNYELAVSCRPSAAGCFGLVFNYQDEMNYARLVCDGQRARVECFAEGRRVVAARADLAYLPEERWCRLRVISADRRLWAFANGEQIMRSSLPAGPTSGRIGLYSIGGPHYFEDLSTRSVISFYQDSSAQLSPRWRMDETDSRADLNLLLPSDFVATARLESSQAVAAITLDMPQSGDRLSLSTDGKTAALKLDAGGESEGLGAVELSPGRDDTTLEIERLGRITIARAGGEFVGRAVDAVQSPASLSLSGAAIPTAGLAELEVLPHNVEPDPVIYETDFRELRSDHDLHFRKSLKSIRGSWGLKKGKGKQRTLVLKSGKGEQARLLLTTPPFPEVALSASFATREKGSGGVFIGVGSSPHYEAVVGRGQARVYRSGAEVFSHSVDVSGETSVELSVVGVMISLSVDGRRLWQWQDPDPLTAGGVGLSARGAGAEFRRVALMAPGARSYRFDRPEPEWQPSCGTWKMHNGMTCLSWTHWTSSIARPQALLWRDEGISGDFDVRVMTCEATQGFPKGHKPSHIHFPMRDVFVILCGDGLSLQKGYVLHLGDKKGKETVLLRNGVEIARTKEFPIVMGSHCNSPRQFDIYARRRGRLLVIYLNGRKAFEFADADPIRSGQVGMGRRNGRQDFSDVVIWQAPGGEAN